MADPVEPEPPEAAPQDGARDVAPAAPPADEGSQNATIYVGRLPETTTNAHLESAFAKFGTIRAIRNVMNATGQCRGFAFVDYLSADAAQEAIRAMNDTEFQGARIVVELPRRKWGERAPRDDGPRQRQQDYERPRYGADRYRERSPPRRDQGYDRYYRRERSPERSRRYDDRYY
jgi:RNA recognition motif-containing protein